MCHPKPFYTATINTSGTAHTIITIQPELPAQTAHTVNSNPSTPPPKQYFPIYSDRPDAETGLQRGYCKSGDAEKALELLKQITGAEITDPKTTPAQTKLTRESVSLSVRQQ